MLLCEKIVSMRYVLLSHDRSEHEKRSNTNMIAG
jgi:hypothetical protein